jgi:hypothetical protein
MKYAKVPPTLPSQKCSTPSRRPIGFALHTLHRKFLVILSFIKLTIIGQSVPPLSVTAISTTLHHSISINYLELQYHHLQTNIIVNLISKKVSKKAWALDVEEFKWR